MSRTIRTTLAITTTVVLIAGGGVASAGEGVMEINQTVVDAGLPPCDATPGFPCTIAQPGSYVLTGNLETTSADNDVIDVTAEQVTLDLNGFGIVGPNTCTWSSASNSVTCTHSGDGDGVVGGDHVTVRNGFVRGMGRYGVTIGDSARVEDVVAWSNDRSGISVSDTSWVMSCQAHHNGSSGISSGYDSVIRDSVAHHNDGRGISATAGSSIEGCVSYFNSGPGIFGAAGVVINHCTARDNVGEGLELRTGAMAIDNLIYSNTGYGITSTSFFGDPSWFACGGNTIRANVAGTIDGDPVEISPNMCEDDTTCP